MLDLIIRHGRIVDGSGKPAFMGDVGIAGDRIVAVGEVTGSALREIDASGLLVVPGFVDIHTHYDGQASWDPMLMPSSLHGVTSIAFGNCGVGFAPALPDRRDWLVSLMEGVEDIPGTALAEGLAWDWETFPDYLDALERREFVLDVGAHLPHAPLRTYVMCDRGGDPEAVPTPAEMSRMAELTVEAIERGALGFSTSRTMVHRSGTGDTINTYRAPEVELLAIAEAMGASGKGVIQLISDAYLIPDQDFADSEMELIGKIARVSGRPVSVTVQQSSQIPDRWRWMLDRIAALQAEGLDVRAQVAARGVGGIMGLRTSTNPFAYTPTWRQLEHLPLDKIVEQMRDPVIKAKLLHELVAANDHPWAAALTHCYANLYRMADPVDYEPSPDKSIEAEALQAGRDPTDYWYDVLLEENGQRLLYLPTINYAHGNLNDVHEMMSSKFALFGLSDGGAHCGAICDASFPTSAVSFWPEGNRAGRKIALEAIVHGYSQRNAIHVGWSDRGVIAPDMLADINIIDLGSLALPPPEPVNDLPAGGMRLVQGARGYRYTIKRGNITFADGVPTGALPGRLVRLGNGAQAVPD